MAIRKPLVLNAGLMQQLQAGDQLDAPVVGNIGQILSNNDSVSIVIGTPVYSDTTGTVKRAQANGVSTSMVDGLVGSTSIAAAATGQIVLSGPLTATTAQWDAVTGQTGGLTTGAPYYLDAAAPGKLTTTAPSTVGQVVAPVGIALSTTMLDIKVRSTVLL